MFRGVSRIRANLTLLALSGGHLGSDFCQGAVPALLPFLVHDRGYSYAQATSLVLASTLGASLAQPAFGQLVDRVKVPAIAPLGVLLAALSIALVGFLHDHTVMLAVVLVGGFGVAAFHPEGARVAARVSGARRAAGMSVFAVGGNLGFALAPAAIAIAVGSAGLHGTAAAAVLPAAGATILALVLWSRRRQIADAHLQAGKRASGPDLWGPFWRLATSACLRSGVYFGLQAFVPAYFVAHYSTSSATGDAALTVILFSGVAGTLCGGFLADVIGRRMIVIGSMALIVPFLLAFLFVGEALAFPLLAVVGFCTVANMSVTVVMGQEYLPNRLGTASGIMLGLAISLGGGIAWLFGLLADATSVRTVMFVIAALPLFAVLAAIGLPETGPARRPLRWRGLALGRA